MALGTPQNAFKARLAIKSTGRKNPRLPIFQHQVTHRPLRPDTVHPGNVSTDMRKLDHILMYLPSPHFTVFVFAPSIQRVSRFTGNGCSWDSLLPRRYCSKMSFDFVVCKTLRVDVLYVAFCQETTVCA